MTEELRGFVKDGLARGMSRADLEAVLGRAGWAESDVQGALTGYADVEFPIPVPRPQPYVSARDAFLYLLMFATLYVSAFSLGRLMFQFINQAFPRPGRSHGGAGLRPAGHALVGRLDRGGLSRVPGGATGDRSGAGREPVEAGVEGAALADLRHPLRRRERADGRCDHGGLQRAGWRAHRALLAEGHHGGEHRGNRILVLPHGAARRRPRGANHDGRRAASRGAAGGGRRRRRGRGVRTRPERQPVRRQTGIGWTSGAWKTFVTWRETSTCTGRDTELSRPHWARCPRAVPRPTARPTPGRAGPTATGCCPKRRSSCAPSSTPTTRDPPSGCSGRIRPGGTASRLTCTRRLVAAGAELYTPSDRQKEHHDRRTHRRSPRHPRAAGPAHARSRAHARLGTGPAHRNDVGPGVRDPTGHALPGAATDEAPGVGALGVATDREQPARPLLLDHRRGAAPARPGSASSGSARRPASTGCWRGSEGPA